MARYHKQVYIPITDTFKLKVYTDKLNQLQWQYSKHSLNNLKYRAIDSTRLLLYIKGKYLNYQDIFEYYTDNIGNIEKAVYRFEYIDGLDIILVIAPNKKIVTIYINSSDDLHYTLKKDLYIKG